MPTSHLNVTRKRTESFTLLAVDSGWLPMPHCSNWGIRVSTNSSWSRLENRSTPHLVLGHESCPVLPTLPPLRVDARLTVSFLVEGLFALTFLACEDVWHSLYHIDVRRLHIRLIVERSCFGPPSSKKPSIGCPLARCQLRQHLPHWECFPAWVERLDSPFLWIAMKITRIERRRSPITRISSARARCLNSGEGERKINSVPPWLGRGRTLPYSLCRLSHWMTQILSNTRHGVQERFVLFCT